MNAIRAAWILPIDRPPIKNGIVEIEHDRIAGIREPGTAVRAARVRDAGAVAVLPGLVNAHTHLELSWLRGRVPPASTFTEWVKTLLAIRGRPGGEMSAEQVAAIDRAVDDVRAFGIAAVGDISNSLLSAAPIQRAGLHGVVFHELLGFNERDGALVESTRAMRLAAARTGACVSLAPHAPYSTSLELLRAIRSAVDAADCKIMSVHLGESVEEVELLAAGTGPWRNMLEWIGAWRDDWVIPRCDPVTYLDRHGLIDARTLLVHGVQFDDPALRRLAAIGATLVTCPRSNQWVGAGYPPIDRFYRSGVRVAVGTDSLASVADLNVFAELQTMRWLAPSVPAARILESATLVGAQALGLADQLGSITPGKRAELIAVQLPDAVDDVEEYLVSGIEPSQVTWVA